MKKLLLLCCTIFLLQGMNAQPYVGITPNNCISTGVDTLYFTLTQAPLAAGDATLTFYYQGDLDGGASGGEFFELYDENNNLVGTSNCTGGCTTSNGQCLSTQDSVKFTIPQATVTSWGTDQNLDFKIYSMPNVSKTLCTTPGSCAQLKVEYPGVSGPNDAGVTGVATISAECSGSFPVTVDIQNFGDNQINPVTINWEINGVLQSSYTHNITLDTLGGTGSNTASVVLGNYTFNVGQNYQFKAWTINPNNVTDTVNSNDTLEVPIRLQSTPIGFTVTNPTVSSVDLSWTFGNTTNSYSVIYGPAGFNPASAGTVVSGINSSPYTLTGLNGSTDYDVYIFRNCGAGIVSDTAGPSSFRTPCTIVTAPWTENFDGPSWTASGNNAGNAIDPCWTANPDMTMGSEPFKWIPRATGPTSGNGPLTDYTGGNFMYVEASGSSAGDTATLVTPPVDVSGLNTPALYFMEHRYSGGTIADMEVDVSTDGGINWANIYSVTGDVQTSSGDPWEMRFINLANYTGDTITIRFTQIGNGCCGDAAIDSVVVGEAPLCPWPTAFNFVGSNSSTATFIWNDPGNTNWIIEFGPTGFQQGTGTIWNTTVNPTTITGLTSNTTYDAYLKADCSGSGNGFSITMGPVTFSTTCNVFTAPFYDNFDGSTWVASGSNTGNQIDNCWLATPDVGLGSEPFKWIPRSTGPTSGNGPTSDATGGNYLYVEASGSSSGDIAEIVMPPIDVSGLTNPALYFQEHRYSGGTIADMDIEVSADAGITWSNVYSITGDIQSSSSSPWITQFVNLASYTNDTIIIKFIQTGNGCCGDAAIDSVLVAEGPACPWPTNLNFISSTQTTADFSFLGGGNGFIYEWGPVGFVQGTGTTDTIYSSPATIGGFSPGQSYDIYIRADCGSNGLSTWIGPVSFSTQCNVLSLPYYESFNNWPLACWDTTGGTAYWQPYNSGGNTFAHADFWSNSTGTYRMATAPIDISQQAQVRFSWSHLGSTSYPNDQMYLRSTVVGSGVWDTIYHYRAGDGNFNDPTAANTAPGNFIEDIHYLPASYVGDTVIVELWGFSSFGPDVYVDNFYVEVAPACVPTSLSNINLNWVSSDSAAFYWTPGDGSSWTAEVGAPGFTPGFQSGIDSSSSTDTTASLGFLSPNTTYELWIRDSCDVGGYSPWTGPFTFTTSCLAFTAPFTEDFDGASWVASGSNANNGIDQCWNSNPDVSMGTEPFKWIPRSTGPTSGNGPLMDTTGGNFMYVEASGSGSGDIAYLTTPAIDLSALNVPGLYFYQHRYSGGTIADLSVQVSNDGGVTWNTEYTVSGDIQSSASSPWEEEFVNLMNYTGDVVLIRFVQTGNGCCGDAAIDDVQVKEAPTCFDPGNLTTTSVIDTSASLSWTGVPNSLSYEVWYGPVGFFQGTQTIGVNQVITTNPSAVLNGLTSQSCYDYYVRAICAVGDTSNFEGPFTFCTPCSAFPAPYTMDFDLVPDGTTGDLGNCWVGEEPGLMWTANTGATSSSNTGPSGDATTGSGIYMYIETSTGANGDSTILISPLVDLTGQSNPRLKFSYHMYGATINKLKVEINNGSNWQTVATISGQQQTAMTAPWKDTSIALTGATGLVQVRFTGFRGSSFTGDLAIDDVEIGDPIINDAGIDALLADAGCGDSTTQVRVAFTNFGINPISNLPVTVNISGSINTTLNATYTGNLPMNGSDTVLVGTINTYNGASVNLNATLNLPSDQVVMNDTVSIGPLDFIPYAPQYIVPDTICASFSNATFIAQNYPGLQYGWFANSTDSTPVAVGDTFTFPLSGPLTWYLGYMNNGDSITTSFAGGNSCGGGNMFDLTTINPVSIQGFAVNTTNAAGTAMNVIVHYIANGSHAGNETTPAAWTTHETVATVSAGSGNKTMAMFTNPLSIPGGTTYGIYVEFAASYTNGNGINQVVANSDMTLNLGIGLCGSFSGTNNPRVFNGTIYYGSQGCSNIRPAITQATSNDTAVAGFTSTTNQGTVIFDASSTINGDIYNWDFGDGNNGTGVNTSHTYTSSGSYNVTLTVTDTTNCVSTSSVTEIVNITIGLDENPLGQSLTVYPNPTNSYITIQFDAQFSSDATIRLTDMSGREIFRKNFHNVNGEFKDRLDISQFAKGVYMLEIRSGDMRAYRRISKN